MRRLTRREHVLSADRAIVLILVLETLVGVKHTNGNAHATFIAVTEGVSSSHSAETALRTMKGLFGLCVLKRTIVCKSKPGSAQKMLAVLFHKAYH